MTNATMIPSASTIIVQNLKEIVNCSEAEIYAMLKECNMDPSEAVHRLLNQDTFHEVKSKRKKKKTKDGPESMSGSVNNYHARSGAGEGRNSSGRYTSIDYGAGYGKSIPRKANGMNAIGSSPNRRSMPTMFSEAASIQNKPHSHTIIDRNAPLFLSQPSGFQNNWSKPMIPGQMSMADTVRQGDSPIKPSSVTTDANPIKAGVPRTKQPPIELTAQELVDSLAHNEEKNQYSSNNDRIWITHEEISSIDPSMFSILDVDETFKLERDSYFDENPIHGGANGDSRTESNRSESSYEEETDMDNSRNSSDQDDTPLSGIDSYCSHRHEVDGSNFKKSSANANLQQLNLPEENFGTTASTEDKPAVIIPSHLQVINADLSHLRFGSFGSNINIATPFGSFPSNHQRNNNLDMAPVMEETKLDQLISRYYDNDQLKMMVDEKATNTWSDVVPLAIQPEVRDEMHGIRGNFSSISDCAFSSSTQLSPTYSYPDLNSQIQNLSPFPMAKSEVLSSPCPTQQTLPNSNIHHPSLTQHLPMHCSQPSLPSGHFADMIDYPFLPQGYTHLAPFLQSQAAARAASKYENVLPQYQTEISGSNLTKSDAFPLGYGGSTGTINNTLGNFNLNPSTALGCTTVGFADALSLRYKDGSHFIPVQHNDKSATWLKEAGSRGISTIRQQQSVLPAFRQAPQQDPPSQYSQMEYLNMHQSQGGSTRRRRQQNRNMIGSQGRMW